MSAEYGNTVECIEGHNAGMPVKVVFLPHVPGETMLEKKEYCKRNLDYIRKMLTYEPRAGSNSYGVVVTNPPSRDAHFGAIYFDPSGWHDMCGHASLFLGSLSIQRNLIDADKRDTVDVRIDTPAGRVTVIVHLKEDGRVDHVSLVNVPSFLLSNYKVSLKNYGEIDVPVVFGGDFYAMVDLDAIGISYSKSRLPEIHDISTEILSKLDGEKIFHPLNKDLNGLYGVRFQSVPKDEVRKMYGILFFGNSHRVSLDRSPSGTSSSAHLAYLYFFRKQIKLGENVEFLSSIDTKFIGVAKEEISVGEYKAIVPEISTVDKGCFITGFSTYVVDLNDPLKEGFEPVEPL